MARNRTVSPPLDLADEGKELWRAAVRQLQQQGTWRPVDVPLLESYVHSVLFARSARRAGQNKGAADAERDAVERARVLLLTPDTRRPRGRGAQASAAGDVVGVA